ncbi:hypothetical protein LTSEINV_6400 [Salmonella enterica subsp. enterica serovar Inverness str. R8-3668]|uniref:Uncharacterized protein n=1 Tax=Salmonella enterica subsp. enterica serovar Inverness str. R8-3668 TaxID=913075 RepID=G5NMM1_SALET|nr:hypothetical protein LTSEINV_6400 [Salmonella enterica subsp. enterica serovar Inverness str. R8-3668]
MCKALFGRTGSQGLIIEVFDEKERRHRNDYSSPDSVKK